MSDDMQAAVERCPAEAECKPHPDPRFAGRCATHPTCKLVLAVLTQAQQENERLRVALCPSGSVRDIAELEALAAAYRDDSEIMDRVEGDATLRSVAEAQRERDAQVCEQRAVICRRLARENPDLHGKWLAAANEADICAAAIRAQGAVPSELSDA